MTLYGADGKVILDDINEQLTMGSRSRYMSIGRKIDKFIIDN
jgi:hypothetical protein